MSSQLVEVRCPAEKHHGKFSTCGSLLGAFDKNVFVSFIVRCQCGAIWHVEYDLDNEFKLTAVDGHMDTVQLPREVVVNARN